MTVIVRFLFARLFSGDETSFVQLQISWGSLGASWRSNQPNAKEQSGFW